jgi:DNA-binding NarL/FixJ family response regulator
MKTDAFKDAGFKGKITAVSPKVELNTRNMHIESIVNYPDIKVLMLTSFLDDEAVLGAVLGGASGYVIKDIKNLDLLEAIRKVAVGEILLDIALISTVTNRLRKAASPASEIYELTDQEQRVLEHIGRGFTNRQIAESMFLAEKTIKNYVSSLLGKLGLERRTQAAALAARLGLGRN